MFISGARPDNVGEQSFGVFKLHFGARHIDRRTDLARQALAREIERRLIGFHGVAQKLRFAVETAQAHVVARQFRLQTDPHRFKIRLAGLRLRLRRLDEIADAAPQIHLVTRLNVDRIRAVIGWLAGRTQRPVCGLFVVGEVRLVADRRIKGGLRLRDVIASLQIIGERRGEIRIGGFDLRLELIQQAVVEAPPPFAVRLIVERLRQLPGSGFLEMRRHFDHRWVIGGG